MAKVAARHPAFVRYTALARAAAIALERIRASHVHFAALGRATIGRAQLDIKQWRRIADSRLSELSIARLRSTATTQLTQAQVVDFVTTFNESLEYQGRLPRPRSITSSNRHMPSWRSMPSVSVTDQSSTTRLSSMWLIVIPLNRTWRP